jgi:glycosyltransferase involved in cell wall biosynthesis
MRVNIAVCGIFHYQHYVGALSRRGFLDAFYYSHRLANGPAALGIVPPTRAFNLAAKAYLLRGTMLMLGEKRSAWAHPLCHDLWQAQVWSRWRPADLAHVMLHGTMSDLLAHERTRERPAIILGEPVNSHPADLGRILAEEHARLALPVPVASKPTRRLLSELQHCDALIVASRALKDSYVRNGFPAEKVFVLPYGSSGPALPDHPRAERPASPFRLLCVGQITPRKGQHHLLEAWRQLALPRHAAELVLAGKLDPEMRPVLARYEGLFTWLGPRSSSTLAMDYSEASAFVLPSLEDGFGLVVGEAMASGLPVITTESCGAADIVDSGEGGNGFVVRPASPEALAEAIGRLYHDPDLRRTMGARSLVLSREEHSWSRYVDGLIAVYQRLGRDSAPGPSTAGAPGRPR